MNREDPLSLYAARLLEKEASELELLYKEKGVSAYTMMERKKRLPKPNKKFLENLVSQTDSHNYSLILEENRKSRQRLDDLESSRHPQRQRSMPDSSYGEAEVDSRSLRIQDERVERRHKEVIEGKSPDNGRFEDCPDPIPSHTLKRPLQMKGRGASAYSQKGIGATRLDKYFTPGYDARLDMDNYDDSNLAHYVTALEAFGGESAGGGDVERKAKKRKKEGKSTSKAKKDKKHKKKKSSKHSDGSASN